jgi:uncharacterized OB-fold protein
MADEQTKVGPEQAGQEQVGPKQVGEQQVMRPEPVATPDSAFFWEGAGRGELLIKQCSACSTLWHPPRPMCPKCHATKMVPARMSGHGTVYSWGMPIHPFPHGFAAPPIVALIDLVEGPRVVSNVVGIDPRAMRNGLAVMVEFEPTAGGKFVPVFRPAGDAA